MQKVVKFLEQYVQWVALGLGLLWVLYIGYSYWAKPPVATTVGSRQVGPSEIDDMAVAQDGPVFKLRQFLDNKGGVPAQVTKVLTTEGPQYTEDFKAKMDLKDVAVAPMNAIFPAHHDTTKTQNPTTNVSPDEKVPLPVLAAATVTKAEISSGLSVAWVPNPAKPADGSGGAAPGAPPANNIGFVNAQAGQPTEAPKTFTPPGAGPDVVPVLMETKEVPWNTVTSRWNMRELQNSFKNGHIPDAQAMTLFLRVRLVREEQMPDGSWGNKKYVDELTNQAKPAWPPKTPEEADIYIDWASKAQADIVEPPFYEIVRGTLWRTASMPDMGDAGDANPDAAGGAAANAFDPAAVKPGEVGKLSVEERKKWMEWKAEQDRQERERRKSEADSRKAATPRGGDSSKRSNSPPPANDRPLSDRPARGAYVPHGAPPAGQVETINPRGGVSSPGRTEGAGVAAGANPPPTPGEFRHGDIPAGRFNPGAQGDLEVWAHDGTAVPGHTYRYKLEISLLNPLYKTQNLAKNPADENKLAIVIETDVTAPVTIPTKQRFFAFNPGNGPGGIGGSKMSFEYFWWEDGKWNSRMLVVQPGDAIPNTGWTVVDLKPVNGSENRAILVHESGEMSSHFYKTDLKDPDYAALKAKVNKATVPPAGGGTTPQAAGGGAGGV